MGITKEQLHELIEKIPKKYYEEVERELKKRIIPVVNPTENENIIIKERREEIKRGEYHTLDEFYNEVEGDD
jgi:hypothetical protein